MLRRINWILCKLGIKKNCRNEIGDQTSIEIRMIEERQKNLREKLKYYGYHVDAFTGEVRKHRK